MSPGESAPAELPDLPDMADLFGEAEAETLLSLAEGDNPALRVVERRFRAKAPEPKPELSEDSPLPPPVKEPPSRGHRTLFLGVPLRTRRGKEVLGAIQQVSNRLEAYGFPVHRFHADRALASKSGYAWYVDSRREPGRQQS